MGSPRSDLTRKSWFSEKGKQGWEYIPALLLRHMTTFPLISGNSVCSRCSWLGADFGRISGNHDRAVDDLCFEALELLNDVVAQEASRS